MTDSRAGLNAANPGESQSPPWRIPLPGNSPPRIVCHVRQRPDSLAGDVYGLTMEDVQTVAMSDQIRGNQ